MYCSEYMRPEQQNNENLNQRGLKIIGVRPQKLGTKRWETLKKKH